MRVALQLCIITVRVWIMRPLRQRSGSRYFCPPGSLTISRFSCSAKEVMTDAEIDGEKLTLKTSSATDQYTEWYLRNKEAKKAAGAKDSAGGADLNGEQQASCPISPPRPRCRWFALALVTRNTFHVNAQL